LTLFFEAFRYFNDIKNAKKNYILKKQIITLQMPVAENKNEFSS
jgi:hypothetical protein